LLSFVSKEFKKRPQVVITARLRKMLFVILALFSILLANGAYLTSITWLQYFTGEVYENHLYQLMFLGHCVCRRQFGRAHGHRGGE